MSLVGTRPPTVDEWEQYELHHRSRMSTKLRTKQDFPRTGAQLKIAPVLNKL